MGEEWLEIADEDISVEDIMKKIRDRLAEHSSAAVFPTIESPVSVAEDLREEMLGEAMTDSALSKRVSLWQSDCDIVPRHYVIDWRMPILGPVHAWVRRLINAEIRRYLLRSLEKQALFNRKMLQALKELAQENAYLRQQIQDLESVRE